jgi:hypothetical protein
MVTAGKSIYKKYQKYHKVPNITKAVCKKQRQPQHTQLVAKETTKNLRATKSTKE